MLEKDRLVELSAKQAKAITCLLTAPTIGQAAIDAGVSEKTIYRWLDDKTFSDAWNAARTEALLLAIGALQTVAHRAVSVLANVMESDSTSPSVKVQAARSLLEFAFKAQESWDHEERLRELEAMAAEGEKDPADAGKKVQKTWPKNTW